MTYSMVVYGKCPSKSNLYRITQRGGHSTLFKTAALEAYEKSFHLQCKHRNADIKDFFKLELDVFHENNRPDLDNALKVVLDCLQANKVIHNDRQCEEILVRKFIDKNEPRVEIRITPVEL